MTPNVTCGCGLGSLFYVIDRLILAAKIIYLYVAKRYSLRGIARKLKVGYNFVRNIVILNKVAIHYRRVSLRVHRQIVDLYTKHGCSIYRISKIVGFGPVTVYKHLTREGILLRKRSDYFTRFYYIRAPERFIAYISGALLGDATVQKSCVVLEVKDKEFAESVYLALKKLMQYGLSSVTFKPHASKQNRYVVIASGKGFAMFMKDYKKWLKIIALRNPIEYLRGFL